VKIGLKLRLFIMAPKRIWTWWHLIKREINFVPKIFYLNYFRRQTLGRIPTQKYLTIRSPHVPNGKPRDRVGVEGGGLHQRV